jgi:hypothetical protein
LNKDQGEDELVMKQKGRAVCDRIYKEEFEYQSTFITKHEINKLINSKQYERAVRVKGAELEQWNWQASDRKSGVKEQAKEEREEDELDLNREFLRVEEEIC